MLPFYDIHHRKARLRLKTGKPRLSQPSDYLAAIALLVAQSDPAQKTLMGHMIMNLTGSE